MNTLQSLALFFTGYLLSRLVLASGAHQVFVSWVIRRASGRLSLVLLGLMGAAFLLSTFVPNALTVLALIPVVTRIRDGVDEQRRRVCSTLLAMGLVYGANIGGVGSLLGSPANLYLLVNLRLFHVDGADTLHLMSWLLFGMPMAIGFLLFSWGMFHVTERRAMSWKIDAMRFAVERGPLHAATVRWALIWLACWSMLICATAAADLDARVELRLSLLGQMLPVTLADLLAITLAVFFVVGLFFWPQDGQRRLLALHDLWRELPIKGVLLGVGVLLLLLIVANSGVMGLLESFVPRLLPKQAHPFVAALVLVLVTIYATELLNNTTVSTVLFPLSVAIGRQLGGDPLLLMLGVSLASTCAFMTPIATPVNALALAGVGGVSLRTFVKNGAIANLVGAVWIALWITWLVSPLLRLFS